MMAEPLSYEDLLKENEEQSARENMLRTLNTVMEGLDAHVYVADLETYEILYLNSKMKADFGGDLTGQICHRVFRAEESPCADCTNPKLLDENGQPAEAVTWEGQNVLTKRWYINHDRVVHWFDGRLVRMQIATDITGRKRAENRVRENEQKLRNIVEHSTNLFYTHDTDHVLSYLSPQSKTILGYEPEEAMVRWTQLATDHPINEVGLELTQRAIETGQPQPPYELELRHQSGRPVWVEVREAPLVVEGRTVAITGALTDITERKKAEDRLRESEVHYRNLFENSVDAIHVTDENDQIINVNDRMCELMGYSREELLTMSVPDLQAPKVRGREGQIVRDEVERYQGESFESYNIRRDGHIFPVELTVSEVETKSGKLYYCNLRDISERKQAEKALRDSQYLLEEAEKMSRLGSFALDIMDGSWTSSENLRQIIGIDAAYKTDLDGWLALVDPDDRPSLEAYFTRYILTQHEDFDREYRIIRPRDRKVRWVHGLGKLEFDKNGNPVRLIGTIQDITGRKRIERQLQESESRYRSLFHNSPYGMWEQDLSKVKRYLDSHLASGETDVRAYFEAHPDEVRKCYLMIGFLDANQVVLEKHNVGDVRALKTNLFAQLAPETLDSFVDQLDTFYRGEAVYEGEVRSQAMVGDQRYSLLRAIIPSRYQHTWERVYLAVIDITLLKQAETIIKRRADEMATLHALTLEITSPAKLDTLLESITVRATELMGGMTGASLFLREPDKQELRCVVSHQTAVDFTGQVFQFGQGVVGTVASTGAPLIVNDYLAWDNRLSDFDLGESTFKVLSVPIHWEQTLVGVVHLFRSEQDPDFRFADLEMVEILANNAAIAIQNARLLQQVHRHADELEERVADRTAELSTLVDAMTGREIRMAELKDVIRKLRAQIEAAGMRPVADDPLNEPLI